MCAHLTAGKDSGSTRVCVHSAQSRVLNVQTKQHAKHVPVITFLLAQVACKSKLVC